MVRVFVGVQVRVEVMVGVRVGIRSYGLGLWVRFKG